MKKNLCLLMALAMVFSLLSVMSFADDEAAEPTMLWDFGKDGFECRDEADLVYEVVDDSYVTFTAKGGDPFVYIDTDIEDVNTITWVKIRIKNPSPSLAVELFAATEGDDFGLNGNECTHIDVLPYVDEWQTYIAYLPNANIYTVNQHKGDESVEPITEWNWQGKCQFIRLDPMWKATSGEMADGDTCEIDYIAFFDSKEAAVAYDTENDSEITPIEFETEAAMPDLTDLMAEYGKVRFTDVPADADYYKAVVYAYVNGLFKGTFDTRFSPDTTMTRAMFVTVLGRLAKADVSAYTKSAFSDVEEGTWYTEYVGWAADNGIVLGYEDETFRPNTDVTVEQAVAIISRYAASIGLETKTGTELGDEITDKADISDWALSDVTWASVYGIYTGTDGALAPKSDAARSLVASMLYNFINAEIPEATDDEAPAAETETADEAAEAGEKTEETAADETAETTDGEAAATETTEGETTEGETTEGETAEGETTEGETSGGEAAADAE